MNRKERRAAKAQEKKPSLIAESREGRPEHYQITTMNGLMRLDVIFGRLRPPAEGAAGESEVREAFTGIVAGLRHIADSIEAAGNAAPAMTAGGDA